MIKKNKLYIIHGYCASPYCHWFGWLKEQLADSPIEVFILNMPTPAHPKKEAWLNTLTTQIPQLDEHTFFIGHSLGCITLLNYLNNQTERIKVGGMILVSAFNQPIKEIPSIDPFINPHINYDKLIQVVDQRVVVTAIDDQIVPTSMSETLAQQLNATLVQLPKGNHFLDKDGYTTFPEVLDLIRKMILK